jgi:hypothetical protein
MSFSSPTGSRRALFPPQRAFSVSVTGELQGVFKMFNRIVMTLAVTLAPVAALAAPARIVIARHFLTPVPEPAVWAMMLVGAGLVGGVLRYRRVRARAAA